jgi:HEAT repeat protein
MDNSELIKILLTSDYDDLIYLHPHESADYIIPLTNSEQEELRLFAAYMLDRFTKNPQAYPALVKLSQDKSPDVRSAALRTLATFSKT